MTAKPLHLLRRYLVTDASVETNERLLDVCSATLIGGITTVQLRVKGWSDRRILCAADLLRQLCSDAGALLIINDRVDIAMASGADGVHLGVDDLPVATARRLLGGEAIIGYSPEADTDRAMAELHGADYLGVGPVYGTATKDDAGPALGLTQFGEIAKSSSLPVVGIGGIGIDAAKAVIDAGAAGVAIVSAVFFAADPERAAQRLCEEVG